ncbi:hypothetical protein [Bradyrhizobium paxllaeri]|uniref:hypothetical protein n=1 Tax=Bradyrhizobium paxllaeri TaxID=190148 RepID=UPI000810C45F|nr:hypothetical protein [Bradyrhizobium paxllaeri]
MPTLGVDFDFSKIKQRAIDLSGTADQIPYIMATTLNMPAENTRSYLIETTWPSSVRNRSFLKAALTTKGSRETKGDPSVNIYGEPRPACHGWHAPSEGRQPSDPYAYDEDRLIDACARARRAL